MLFTDPVFLFCFLPLVLLLYYLAPRRARNFVLALASLIFYAAGEWRFLAWLLASVAVNYVIGRAIAATRGRPAARRWLALGLASDLALLLAFKYFNFAMANVNTLRGWFGAPPLQFTALLLPLGISFFTFHKITYKVDVYRGVAEAKRQPLDLALYILLFPQLIAGPIVRYHEIAAELVRRVYRREDFAAGVRRFVQGFARKMIVANPAGYCADRVFALPAAQLTSGLAWLGLLCYTVQIYFDFAGYSDMAIGLARMFGFHFPENFNYPYISGSITEFWRRWHMSLSRFFRDYLYIPLGGNRRGPARTYLNLTLVFFLCGFWHGASWNFALWGMMHGALLVTERVGLRRALERAPRLFRHAYTLLFVSLAWVFFRADTLPHALTYVQALFGLGHTAAAADSARYYLNRELLLALTIGVLGSMPLLPWLRRAWERRASAANSRPVVSFSLGLAEVAAFVLVLFYSGMLSVVGTYNPFIYFRF